ncbi:TM2 domain-containing protein [Galbibacter mesophilus]|uniref:TM2 domain-containing protein n=1 Tax=Galbibacter mesophilus TaxID=379069 RepID=UPI00191DCCDC|nr:TM2 domain-containing protein [Galbibacter mesophilus]MCM5664251.1 TM2 domain-containing protein [Galbibacter mesophilus]
MEDKRDGKKSYFEENAENFAKETKNTANEFAENAKEAFADQNNKKVISGILAILFGAFGIHKFILGYQKEGLIMLLGTLLTCGILGTVMYIIGIIEGIIYLTKSDEEFFNTYQVGKKPWF